MNKRNRNSTALLPMLAFGAMPLAALAAPPATSPYVLDPQHAYVEDATSEGISNLNMVLCIMDAMKPSDMVNKGSYIALVDKNKCDSGSKSSASNSTSGASGATSAPDYMTATVNVTRASDADPMLGKIWMSMTEEGQPIKILVHVSADQSPADKPPYGKFRLDYIGKVNGTTQFNGYIDASGADVSYFETGAGSNGNALALQATSTTSGSGTMQAMDYHVNPPAQVTFNFAYDSSETNFPAGVFRRNDGTNDICFDRSQANAKRSVWRYGTYDATTGERVDQTHPGFPVLASYSGNTYFGYASYWGVNFQGLDVASLADSALVNVVVTDQRPNNSNTYTLSKNSGKLTRWSQNQATLASMDGIPFQSWGDLTGQTANTGLTNGNWQMHWDNANSRFVVTGTQSCSTNGCVMSTLNTPAPITGANFDNMSISGWSDSFGGNINIPPHIGGGARAGADNVYFYTQSDIIPGSTGTGVPTTLYCLSNCPTSAAITSFAASTAQTPFGNGTDAQWMSAPGTSNTVTYGYGSTGLTESSTALAITDASVLSGQFQNGVMSGRLFSSAFNNTDCPSFLQGGSDLCEPPNPTEYYTWQTGAQQWNQSMWLTKQSDSSVVIFDPPENIAYTVPSDAVYGGWAGKSIQLQFNGFGNVSGIPGGCVDPTDNTAVDCGASANARYVPEFSLPDGATMTLTSNSQSLIVKALDAELRLSKANCANTSLAAPSSAATLPTSAGIHDPSSSTDSTYLGTKPVVTDVPKVIHGVIQ